MYISIKSLVSAAAAEGAAEEASPVSTMLAKIFELVTEFVLSFGMKLLAAVIVLIVGFKVGKWIVNRVGNGKRFQKVEPGAQSFIKSCLNIIIKALVILTAASILGVPMTNFVAAIGSIGLAIGLAMQGSLSNVAGGLMILIFHPFKVGDFITSSGVSGTVKEITILYTVLDTPDNIRIVVPNGTLSNATVENYSINEIRRCDVVYGISYKNDPQQAIKLLSDMASKHELVLKDKDVFCKITSLDDSQITITLRAWVNAGDYWGVKFDLLSHGKALFDQNGIEVPYPQLDVHVNNN